MSSDTTKAQLQTVYDRLIAYADSAGRKLTDYLSVSSPRLYVRLSSDAVQYPYVVFRVSDAEPDVEFANLRTHFTIEARCVHRTEDGTVEQIADLVEEALLTWQESSALLGFTRGQSSRRESQEPLTDAPNRDLAEVTVYVTCFSWATRLTGIVA
jgi:hypothetical protein